MYNVRTADQEKSSLQKKPGPATSAQPAVAMVREQIWTPSRVQATQDGDGRSLGQRP